MAESMGGVLGGGAASPFPSAKRSGAQQAPSQSPAAKVLLHSGGAGRVTGRFPRRTKMTTQVVRRCNIVYEISTAIYAIIHRPISHRFNFLPALLSGKHPLTPGGLSWFQVRGPWPPLNLPMSGRCSFVSEPFTGSNTPLFVLTWC